MGVTLLKSLLSSEHCVSKRTLFFRVPSNHQWVRRRTIHWRTQHCHWSLNESQSTRQLHEILCQCLQEVEVPQDMLDAKIITLYKNKGERTDCNSYRGIFLVNIVGKILARVIFVRLQQLAERVYLESQCGFRSGQSTVDMIFSVRQLQEKCREQNKSLSISFIDLTKDFDLVSKGGLFTFLTNIGCPPKLKSIIESFHNNM